MHLAPPPRPSPTPAPPPYSVGQRARCRSISNHADAWTTSMRAPITCRGSLHQAHNGKASSLTMHCVLHHVVCFYREVLYASFRLRCLKHTAPSRSSRTMTRAGRFTFIHPLKFPAWPVGTLHASPFISPPTPPHNTNTISV